MSILATGEEWRRNDSHPAMFLIPTMAVITDTTTVMAIVMPTTRKMPNPRWHDTP